MPSDLQVSNIRDLTNANSAISIASDGQVTIAQNNPTITLGSNTTFPGPPSTGTFNGGHILQVKQLVDTTNRTLTNNTFQSVGTELSITPSSSTNKILISVQAMIGSASSNFQHLSLIRDSTDLTPSGTNGMIQERPPTTDASYTSRSVSFNFIDSPNTSSSVTYKLSAKVNSGTMTLGKRQTDTLVDVPTFLTLMEIVA